ncbi:hypothetical protein [Natranaerobius trueperi]|uniref:Uncharacterized protein n=1 Tax=Natranaerobius trueperi TaxID=759412 RepID=A0A226BUW8_9FIRM|nr:hypothetical protein [Natranaerobius trueperi]OWZ82775.1 hypothetical protein CDO51_12220 [Natranaerobius trueperi]
MNIKLECHSDSKLEDICCITRDIYNSLGLTEKSRYKLHFGKTTCNIKVKPCDKDRNEKRNILYLSSNIFKPSFTDCDLTQLENISLNIWRNDERIYLGPVLGIFVKSNLLTVPKKKKD